MEILISVLIICVVVGFVVLFLRVSHDKKHTESQSLVLLQNQVQEIARTLDRNMGESHKSMQVQFQQSTKIIQDVTERLTRLDETNKQVMGFADQLKGLQDILKNPKQRGILGEYYLETILKNVFPPGSYQMQYAFKNGEIVDAVVFVDEKIVPIDSKFSLDNYNRYIHAEGVEQVALEKTFVNDLKLRITETPKYIRPEENTMDFAFMFIPS